MSQIIPEQFADRKVHLPHKYMVCPRCKEQGGIEYVEGLGHQCKHCTAFYETTEEIMRTTLPANFKRGKTALEVGIEVHKKVEIQFKSKQIYTDEEVRVLLATHAISISYL